jgi:hypothetical protein
LISTFMTVCRCLSLDAVVASKVGRKQTAGASGRT